jgi:hypothetical protein
MQTLKQQQGRIPPLQQQEQRQKVEVSSTTAHTQTLSLLPLLQTSGGGRHQPTKRPLLQQSGQWKNPFSKMEG